MRLLPIDPAAPDPAVLEEAARVLRAGGLVAFPTETVYGLGAHALDPAAVGRIYAAKGRPAYNPLIVHVASAAEALTVVRDWPPLAGRRAEAFWPGPLTLVLPRRPEVPDEVAAGLPTVAVRVPAHPVALALLRAARIPVAAPSANRSTEVSPTTARHVAKSLGDAVDLILDGGPTSVGIESTVLDLSRGQPTILRPGVLGPAELEPVTGPLAIASAAKQGAPLPSPGMMDRHYAPRARVRLYDAKDAVDRGEAMAEATVDGARGGTVGALVVADHDVPAARVVRLGAEPRAYASALYGALHDLDDAGCTLILIERVPTDVSWMGVRDRLERASR